jgi:hypothetical protein
VQRLPENPSRKVALEHIASSAQYGNLGAFVGAGLSKAILNDEFDEIALSWGDLIEKASTAIGVNYTEIEKSGRSYPEIASLVCAKHAENMVLEYEESLRVLKRKIAELTAWYPNAKQRQEYSEYLEALSPSWIITTNYDLIIEALLTGKSTPLGPNDALSAAQGIVPVFHLHGRRTNPEEIVIAQEDYVALFRPGEYRQVKLALTIKESTTVLLGYGLGDVNVLTAIDWSRNVYGDGEDDYPADVIQVLRKENPRKDPYRDRNKILIMETADLPAFFIELTEVKADWIENYNKKEEAVREIANKLDEPDDALVDRFIDDSAYRDDILKAIAKFPIHLVPGFMSFLSKAIDKTYVRTIPNGAFEGYNQNLNQILDILNAFRLSDMSPALFQAAAYAFDRVGYYVGHAPGQSYAAGDTWKRRKGELSAEMVAELKSFAKQHYCANLKRLMKDVVV